VTGQNVNPDEGQSATSSSLLQRVKAQDQQAWERLVTLYSPLVYRWCRKAGLQEADAADVGQEVFVSVARAILGFRHDQAGNTFRGWLRTITQNKLRDHARKLRGPIAPAGGDLLGEMLQMIPADVVTEPDDEAEDTSFLYRRALEVIGVEFEARSRQAFWRVAVEGQHPQVVAADLGMTINAVYLVKSRILRRLREELTGLVDI
jgi:RNA polymerase sigma-70 factor (ECF subfamily)